MRSSSVTSLRFSELTYEEIRERAQAGWLAVVPTGCTEQQGPHLPVDFDTWFAETLMVAAADRAVEKYRVNSLVLPAMPFGPTLEHRSYGAGYIHIPTDLHGQLVLCVLNSLAEQGFQKLIVWRGCGGHALEEVIASFNQEYKGRAQAYLPAHPYHAIWCRIGDPKVPTGHADSYTTSIMLHLRPNAVRVDRIARTEQRPMNWEDPNLDFARYSATGVIGDPTYASAELGARLWEETIDAGARVLKEIGEAD